MKPTAYRTAWRSLKASWRDTLILLREFGSPLLMFIIVIIGSGLLYDGLADLAHEPVASIPEALYLTLTMTFLQPNGSFPYAWYLQIFFFIMPLIGISILAQGLADFTVLFFNRKARSKEWEMAVASTLDNHIILVGMGHLGFRVVVKLHEMDQDVVVVTLDPGVDLIEKVRTMGIPVIKDDGTRESVLKAAGIHRARSIILCTQTDSLNLQIALKSRTLNPKINVIVRIFDDDFAESLQTQFGFHAFSATGMAAPIFAASAVNIDLTPPINIAGIPNSLARINVNQGSPIIGESLDHIEKVYRISVVVLDRNQKQELHPNGDTCAEAGDVLAILGPPEHISKFVYENQK
jgi:voltage-gated potassium channel